MSTAGSQSGRKEAQPDSTAGHTKSLLRDYTETILICVIFVVFSRAFVFQQSKIPSGSMMDTLLVGDYIMVNRFIYAPTTFEWERALLPTREVRRGDVVVFKYPLAPEVDYIKRVIGLPGDTVDLRDGYLYVNGELHSEPYIQEHYRWDDPRRDYGPVTIEPGHYLMLGDHRNASKDSRVWGALPGDLMKGRALLIWWSYDEQANPNPSVGEQLQSWGSKARHFFTRSRWRRCFTLIR